LVHRLLRRCVDYFIANSEFIARRIWKVYRREATVIYPPVDTARFEPTKNKEEFFLTVSRLVPYASCLVPRASRRAPGKHTSAQL
jgi:glycosyltransferase involved in cell wall biosynthesis